MRIPTPDALTGDGDIIFTEWLVAMTRWLRSNYLLEGRWLNILIDNPKDAAMRWMNLMDLRIAHQQREAFVNWGDWVV